MRETGLLDAMVERVTVKTGKGSETVTGNERGKREIGTRGTRIGKGKENEREIGRGNENVSVTGIVMGVEIVGTGIAGMRETGRNVLQLESPLESRGNLSGGNLRLSPLRYPWRHLPGLRTPRPGIGLPPRAKTDWVSDADLLTMT